MVMPGDNVAIEVELLTPIAMEKTIRFAIREGAGPPLVRVVFRTLLIDWKGNFGATLEVECL